MKKWGPWLIAILILILLTLRLVYSQVDNMEKEKDWYISELHYNCSLRIDSIIRPGRALVVVVNGMIDPDREWQLKDRLQANKVLHLIIVNKKWYDVRVPINAAVKDSLFINSDHDQLLLYRDGKLLSKHRLSESLRPRPF